MSDYNAKQSRLSSDEWSGPFTAIIPQDTSVSDNCGSSINNTEALKPYDPDKPITVRVTNSCETVEFETKIIKRSSSGARSATFPIHERNKLTLAPGYKIQFWVKQDLNDESEEIDGDRQIAVKPNSGVYHLCDDSGGILCNHTGATKPGTSSNGFLRATFDDASGDWKCCDVCDSMDGLSSSDLTYTEYVRFIQHTIGTGERSDSFNKHELHELAKQLFDSEESFRTAMVTFLEGDDGS